MVFVSVDEDYDTSAVLRAFVARFGGGTRALRGDLQRLHLFTRQLDLQFVKSWSDEGDAYWFDHSGALVLIDPELRALAGFDYPLSPDDLVRRVGDIVDWVARTP
jgi:cytochrome oxidase Cu insertion factor (SCO1/SenC/PrrC family)